MDNYKINNTKEIRMDNFKITWKSELVGDIEIKANSPLEAKEKLNKMDNVELINSSNLWKKYKQPIIESVDTDFGVFDEETWLLFDK